MGGALAGVGRLLVATGNAGKVREFGELFAPVGWACVSLKELAAERGQEIPEPEETGRTFRANACLKASAYARASGMWTLADDSGLEVDALGGGPGVHSARWAEKHGRGAIGGTGREGKDGANNALLLEQLAGVEEGKRRARFVCVLALAGPGGEIVMTTRGTVEGEMLREARGAGGFGYDPLFLVRKLEKTTAELSSEEKHAISHRGAATRAMVEMMVSEGLVFGETGGVR